jgi:hypothetical protein
MVSFFHDQSSKQFLRALEKRYFRLFDTDCGILKFAVHVCVPLAAGSYNFLVPPKGGNRTAN